MSSLRTDRRARPKYVFQFATYLSLALSTALGSGNVAVAVAIGALAVAFIGYLIAVIPIVGISAASLVVIPFGLFWVRRLQEYEADTIAAEIGYRDSLSDLLTITTPSGEKTRSGWRYRIGETHPSNPERVGWLGSLGSFATPIRRVSTVLPQTATRSGTGST
jgi:Zn-dependent protease with chaperone function